MSDLRETTGITRTPEAEVIISLRADLAAERATSERLRESNKELAAALTAKWRGQAVESREESGRIRRTIKEATDAEERCLVRAEVWDNCAAELEQAALAKATEAGAAPTGLKEAR